MYNPDNLYDWSKQRHEEALREAQKERLTRRSIGRSTPAALLLVMLALVAILLGLSGCSSAASSGYDTGTARPSADQYTASPSAEADTARFTGMRSSSLECYTFYSDGTVELRHGGTSAISDSGSYQGDDNFGEIVWDSGRWTSTVVAERDGLIIDDVKFSPVTSCF